MNLETVEITKKGRTAVITMTRPNAANALNTQLGIDMGKAFSIVEEDDEIWTVVITGAGDRAFCAGADMKERNTLTADEYAKQRKIFLSTYSQQLHMTKPVIAAVNGATVGGGLIFALHSDIIYASENARFSMAEVKLGLVGGTANITRMIGKHKAKELLFTGSMISAQEALDYGLINKVVKQEELMDEVLGLCDRINANAPLAVRQAKKLLNFGMEVDLDTAMLLEAECYNSIFSSQDRLEGLRAFNEKRKPEYIGK